MKSPYKKIENNKILNSQNKESYLFTSCGTDLEQKNLDERESLLNKLKVSLNRIPTGKQLKIYSLNGEVFLNSFFDSPTLEGFTSNPLNIDLAPFIDHRDMISKPDFRTGDYVKLNGKYLRFLSVSHLEEIDLCRLMSFGDYFLVLEKRNTIISKNILDISRRQNHASLYELIEDIDGVEAYKENNDMLKKIILREEELFKVEIYFVIKASTEIELSAKTDILKNELEVAGLFPIIESMGLNEAFKSYIPGIQSKMSRHLDFHTSLLINSLPLQRDTLAQKGVNFHSRSGRELSIDLWSGDNYSLAITGTSGNGKTVLANKLIDSEYSAGNSIFAFEPKGDYFKQALLKNAHIIDEKINPLDFKDTRFIKDFILSRVPKSERTALWQGKLDNALKKIDLNEYKEFMMIVSALEKTGFKDLSFYFSEIEKNLTNKTSDIDNRFVYVNMESFSNDCIPTLLTYSFQYLKRFKGKYKFLVDECNRVLKHDPDFLEERIREMRSNDGGMIPISQSYKDFSKTDFGQAVIDNCDHEFFFSQPISESENINSFDVACIKSLETIKGQYSEFYYKLNSKYRKILRYHPTPKELEVFHSDKEENTKFFDFINKNLPFFDLDTCINSWVRFKHG
jgi:hypothetical protein